MTLSGWSISENLNFYVYFFPECLLFSPSKTVYFSLHFLKQFSFLSSFNSLFQPFHFSTFILYFHLWYCFPSFQLILSLFVDHYLLYISLLSISLISFHIYCLPFQIHFFLISFCHYLLFSYGIKKKDFFFL